MRRVALLILAASLAGCAAWRGPGEPALCPAPRAAQALLTLHREGDAAPRRLIVHLRPQSQGARYVALDTVGSPLFDARWSAAGWHLEKTGLYRGAAPRALLSGYQWWQSRAALDEPCAQSARLTLTRTGSGASLSRGGHTVWRWRAARPNEFELPQQAVTVTVREKH